MNIRQNIYKKFLMRIRIIWEIPNLSRPCNPVFPVEYETYKDDFFLGEANFLRINLQRIG